MIFDLVRDFADALAAMSAEHPRYRILKLLDEAIRRNVHFIHRHRQDYPQRCFSVCGTYGWWHGSSVATAELVPDNGDFDGQVCREDRTFSLRDLACNWKLQKNHVGAKVAMVAISAATLPALGMGRIAFLSESSVQCLAHDRSTIATSTESIADSGLQHADARTTILCPCDVDGVSCILLTIRFYCLVSHRSGRNWLILIAEPDRPQPFP